MRSFVGISVSLFIREFLLFSENWDIILIKMDVIASLKIHVGIFIHMDIGRLI